MGKEEKDYEPRQAFPKTVYWSNEALQYRKRYRIEIGFEYPPTALLYLTTMGTHWTQRRWPSISVLLVITVISIPLTRMWTVTALT